MALEIGMEGEMDGLSPMYDLGGRRTKRLLAFCERRLIALRKQFSEVFSYGTVTWHYDDDKKAFSLTTV